MNWEGVDERLIRRGELLLSLEFMDSYDGDSEGYEPEEGGPSLQVDRSVYGVPVGGQAQRGFSPIVHTLTQSLYTIYHRNIVSLCYYQF